MALATGLSKDTPGFHDACVRTDKCSCLCRFSDSLAFATEPVVGSLANFLGNQDRMPNPAPPEIKVSDARAASSRPGTHGSASSGSGREQGWTEQG